MIIRAFITHKLAENYSDCQDRFGVNIDTKSIAVSDGMGSTWQQKIWAQLLVDAFTDSTDWFPTRETIKPLCKSWRNKVIYYIDQLKERPRTGIQQKEIKLLDALIYRNERGLALGYSAGATFVGIRFEKNLWKGSVLGDSCLIEWDGSIAKFYTSQDVEEFDSYPDYFDSDELKQGKGTPKDISGTLEKGGYLLLVSDPFSDFLFEHNKQGDVAMYMQQLLKLSSHDEFEILVDEWRKAGMPNDDTTLVIVEPDDSDEFSIDNDKYDDINKLIEEEKKLIVENKEEVADQIPAPISNKQIESGPDTNAIVEDGSQIKQSENRIESPQLIIPSANAIEEKKEETEQIPVSDSNKQTESESDTNAIVEDGSQIKQSKKQIESPQLIIPSDKAIEEHKEDEKENAKLVPVEAKVFVDELLTEYKHNTDGFLDSFKYALTEDAVMKAGYSIFKKYNIFNK